MTVAELVALAQRDAEVTRLSAEHRKYAAEIQNAIEVLARKQETRFETMVPAVLKAADAIVNGVRVFISYKMAQPKQAETLREILMKRGFAGVLHDPELGFPFLAARTLKQGQKYRDAILSALDTTHWFILLLPDANLDRTWTTFEAGYFRRAMLPGDRLICIHHPEVEKSGPLEDFNAVEATVASVSGLLRELLNEAGATPGKKPINPVLADADIRADAEQLVATYVPLDDVDTTYYTAFADIVCPDLPPPITAATLRSWPIMAGSELRSVFGYGGDLVNGTTLGDILKPIDKEPSNRHWVDDLAVALDKLLVQNETPSLLLATFRGMDGQFYSPALHSVGKYRRNRRVERIRITFHQALTEPRTAAPGPLTALASALRQAYRFRYEVLDLYENATRPDEVDEVARLLKEMEIEGEQRGFSRPDARLVEDLPDNPVYAAFDEEDRQVMDDVFLTWRRYRAAPGDPEGLLDKALRLRKPADLAKCLRELRSLNATFMRMGSRRYAKLIAQEFRSPGKHVAHASAGAARHDNVVELAMAPALG